MAMKLCVALALVVVVMIAEAEGVSRFLAESTEGKTVKCKKNPRVCVTDQNSAGPYCCSNKCVDLLTDNRNCGRCKHKCKYSTQCCNGVCTALKYDSSNCGSCGNKCTMGTTCSYGMCSYN